MSRAAPPTERVEIDGPAGALEAIVQAAADPIREFAVICHPHPLHGGTLHNKVVVTIARACEGLGIATLRFNFRGVGASAGHYDEARGEVDDAIAVLEWARRRWPGAGAIMAGFSFGSYVAMKVALVEPVVRLIMVAPPVRMLDFGATATPSVPWTVIQGDADEIVDPAAVIAWAEGAMPRPSLVVLPGTGHFFHGRLSELKAAIVEKIRSGDAAPGSEFLRV